MPSSISSSERALHGRGLAKAFFLAVGLVVLVEIVFRLMAPSMTMRYSLGLGSYYEIRHTIEAQGPADIAILGSSRGREAVLVPDLERDLEQATGRHLSVANYSCSDGSAADILPIARLLTSGADKPSLVVYVVSPRTLRGNETNTQRQEVFGIYPDQYGQKSAHILASLSEKPLWDIRNFLGEHYLTFRHRYWVRAQLTGLARGRKVTSPVQGEYSPWQLNTPNRSLLNRPVAENQVRSFIDRLLDADGNYPLGESRIQAMAQTLHICRDNRIPVVLVAAPLPTILTNSYPAGLMARFDSVISELSAKGGAEFLRDASAAGVVFSAEDFREQSHLNRQGAAKFTGFLAQSVVLPHLAPAAVD